MTEKKAKIALIISCVMFGMIGIFRRNIPLDSGVLAMCRGFLGAAYLFVYLAIKKQPFSFKHFTKKQTTMFILTGAVIGFNWLALFEAYNYTTVATATLCYYMQPIFLIIASPFVFGEKITKKKALCAVLAFIGMIFVSGILKGGFNSGSNNAIGIMFGLISGVLYAGVVIMNKQFAGDSIYEKTALELFSAGAVMFVYLLARGQLNAAAFAEMTTVAWILVMIVGVFSTGVIYAMYFGAIEKLPIQTSAIYGYIDPVVAIISSWLIFGESMGVFEIIGAVLILGSTLISDLSSIKKRGE